MIFFEVIGNILLAENKYSDNITSKLHNIIVEQQKLSETIFKNSIITHALEQLVVFIDQKKMYLLFSLSNRELMEEDIEIN